MAGGRVQVNGVTYETTEVSGEASATQLRQRLMGGGEVQLVSVVIDGSHVQLAVNPAQVWAAATWHAPQEHGRASAV